jgi:hypothetical protein
MIRAHRNEAHRRPRNCLADRRRVRRVVLLPANIGLDIGRRHHARVVAQLDQLARPMMRRTTGLQPDKASGQRSEEGQKLVALDRLIENDLARRIDAVDLKDVLGQINANPRDRRSGAIGQTIQARTAPSLILYGAPMARWTLHDLRRTGRTLMSRAGVPDDHAERAIGHVIGGVRETYDRWSYINEKRQAFESLAGLVDRILDPKSNVVQFAEASK